MGKLTATKRFNEIVYFKWGLTYATKAEASKRAREHRAEGHLARVVPIHNLYSKGYRYALYIRKRGWAKK